MEHSAKHTPHPVPRLRMAEILHPLPKHLHGVQSDSFTSSSPLNEVNYFGSIKDMQRTE
jgi:hypothetical protein